MSSSTAISPIKELDPVEEIAKVLPELQANIRRFLAVRRYEVMKTERAEKIKKEELKVRKEQQRNRMLALSAPRVVVTPTPPKAGKSKPSTSNSSPAMQNRHEIPPKQKRVLNALEAQKFSATTSRVDSKSALRKDLKDDIIPVQKWDQNITSLMKNINDITLALNMHDTTIISQSVKKVSKHGSPTALEGLGYFNFTPDSVPFPDLKLSKGTGAKPIPPADTSPQMEYSQRVKGVLAGIESEYAVLERTNEQIKQALAKSNLTIANGVILSNSIPGSTQHSAHNSLNNSANNSPSKLGALTSANLTSSNKPTETDSDTRSQHSATGTLQSSLVTDDSGMYVPIRRSGDARLDLMVQETLIRASNSIMDSTIEENKAYHGDELGDVMHNVAIQLNNTYKAIEDSTAAEERHRKGSSSSVDSVGLDALTRSITAIQRAGNVSSSTEQTPFASTDVSQNPSNNPSNDNSANNSIDSNASVDTHTTVQSDVSELTMAIQDILANLSGGLFERAKLELSDPQYEYKQHFSTLPQYQPPAQYVPPSLQRNESYGRNEGSIGDVIMNKVKHEMGSYEYGDGSPLPQLEMAEYLNSVNGNSGYPVPSHAGSYSHHSPGHAPASNPSGQYHSPSYAAAGNAENAGSGSQGLSPYEHRSPARASKEQEMEDLQVLLQHQERSMLLIRDSIRAIEEGKLDAVTGSHALQAAYNNLGSSIAAAANDNLQLILATHSFSPTQSVGGDSYPTEIGQHSTGKNPPGGAQYTLAAAEVQERQPSPLEGKTRKVKVKRKKRSNKPSVVNQQMPTAEELDLLRNFGSYLKQQKQALKENQHLSYDELLQKAQADMGLQEDEDSAAQRARVHDMVFRQHQERQQQRYEEEVARKQQLIAKKKKNHHGSSKASEALYPIYDSGIEEGSEAEEDEVAAAIHEYKSISAAYTDSQKDLHARRRALDEEIERYNKSHKVPIQEVQRQYAAVKSSMSVNTGAGASSGIISGVNGGGSQELSPQSRKVFHQSKEPFNMRDALLQSPALSSSGKKLPYAHYCPL